MAFPIDNKSLVSKQTFNAREYRYMTPAIRLDPTATANYDLNTMLGDEVGKYDLTKMKVEAYIQDSDSASPTYGYLVNAEAVVALGWKLEGQVRVANMHSSMIDVLLFFTVPLKPLA